MVLITGATGHIGNNLVRVFIEHMVPCRLLLRRLGPALEGLAVDYVIGDIFNPDFLLENVHQGDVLIHVAGVIDLNRKNRHDSDAVNVDGTKIIADYCALHHVRLIYVSSVDAINKPSNGDPIVEPDHFDFSKIKSHYAKAKAHGTAYVLNLINKGCLKGAIVYPSAVIGINDFKPSAAGKQIMKACNKKILPYIKGGYNFIDVRDTALALFRIAVHDLDGSFILASNERTIKEFYNAIRTVSDHKQYLLPVPNFLAKFGSLFFKDISYVMIDALAENYHYVNQRMIEVLKIDPIPFETTVKDTIEWFLNQKS
jgi:dihydroflavonol-4-reductase